MVELATGRFPYENCQTDFEMMTKILNDDPPKLPADKFSEAFVNFVEVCLRKNFHERPKYKQLLEHPFIKASAQSTINLQTWLDVVTGPRRTIYPTCSLNYPHPNRHSARLYRSTTNPTSSPSPGSSRSRYEDFALPSPRPGARDFHGFHSDSTSSLRTPSTPGTPSPNAPPEPPPRYSHLKLKPNTLCVLLEKMNYIH